MGTTQPSCFGKLWDGNNVECKGGLDPAYRNPRDETHRRDRCSWFESCLRTMQQPAPQTPQQAPIPAQSLVRPMDHSRPPIVTSYSPPRPPYIPPPPASPPQPFAVHTPPQPTYYQQPQYQQPPPQVHHQPQYPQQYPQQQQHPYSMVPPHIAQFGPQYVVAPYQMPGMYMPNYLTVPEPVTDDVGIFMRLGCDLLRTVFKSCGHTLAAFWDTNPFRRHRDR